ncbi:formimidoylglutamate deiminase [uncultured Roseobacter sp.]|uniref:formimidoylglutamate deiminase n=1 Tax=uncultured Roseobacter sp. TaxID=114847 RepID=UPI0026195E96|nr:formimidoylglutamate deiminase [uncultured Roseobacter sp.]
MPVIWSKYALTSEGWARDVRVDVDDAGRIAEVRAEQPAQGTRADILLPAPVNVHSHAFQRAMAGLSERRGPDPRDSFWTWRQLMFRFLDQLTPDDVAAITAFVQMEMLEAGFGASVEFHYLHHQPGGAPYDRLSEMSEQIVSAAETSGIGLVLLPVHYQYGGCDKRGLGPGQVRFGNDPERFAKLWQGAQQAVKTLPEDAAVGVAPHSLRAVAREDLATIAGLAKEGPIHMHLAEQQAEVEEVVAAWGARPTEWLLDNLDITERWCLIHCTQLSPREAVRLAATGAVAGLCPITESSLGDGIFDGVGWQAADGAMAIGSDSNIRISLVEELRTLEYSQRLRDHGRAIFATQAQSTGRVLFDAVVSGGAQAAARGRGGLQPGAWADMLALDGTAPDLVGREGDTILDSFIFVGDQRMIRDVWSAGRHLVQDGKHIHHRAIRDRYVRTLAKLRDVM